jgi:hypothetical protein
MPTSLVSTGVQFPSNDIQTRASGANTQTFTSSGTWTKPSIGHVALIRLWGGGGSGARGGDNGTGAAGGGGGSGYSEHLILLGDLNATETVTIGAGGAARTTLGNGAAGGDTIFKANTVAFACGGRAGQRGGSAAVAQALFSGFFGGIGGAIAGAAGGDAFYGGGGGGGGTDLDFQNSVGGSSRFGGAGGGGRGFNQGAAIAGTAPGGGGGGAGNTTSGAGGAGRVVVIVW